jgi:glutathione S-transferase
MARDGFYRLYASEVSYFSGKVRPAFRYKRVPFVEILATTAAYRDVIRPRIGFAMIPVVVTPEDETVQDSSDILDALERRFPEPPLYPATPVQRLVGYLVELYADEFLELPALHYRWSFPESEAKARADFAATTGDVARANRFADAIKSFVPMVGVLP